MSYYAYHDPNGRITAYTQYPPGQGQLAVELQAANEGPLAHYVDNGAVVPFPPRPSLNHDFDYTTKQWFDPRPLTELQALKWGSVKAAREEALVAPLTTPFGVFDADAASQKSITDAVLMLQTLASLGQPTTIDFTLADNTVVTLNGADMVMVGLALGQRTQQVHATARALRAAIETSTSIEELDLISWPAQ